MLFELGHQQFCRRQIALPIASDPHIVAAGQRLPEGYLGVEAFAAVVVPVPAALRVVDQKNRIGAGVDAECEGRPGLAAVARLVSDDEVRAKRDPTPGVAQLSALERSISRPALTSLVLGSGVNPSRSLKSLLSWPTMGHRACAAADVMPSAATAMIKCFSMKVAPAMDRGCGVNAAPPGEMSGRHAGNDVPFGTTPREAPNASRPRTGCRRRGKGGGIDTARQTGRGQLMATSNAWRAQSG